MKAKLFLKITPFMFLIIFMILVQCSFEYGYGNTKQQAIYISLKGDDSNPGTKSYPVKTLDKAIEILVEKKYNRINMTKGTYSAGTHSTTFSPAFLYLSSSILDSIDIDEVIISGGWSNDFSSQAVFTKKSDYTILDGKNITEYFFSLDNVDNITIEGFYLKNSSTSTPAGGVGLTIFNCNKLTIKNMFLDGLTSDTGNSTGIYVADSDNIYFKNITIDDCSTTNTNIFEGPLFLVNSRRLYFANCKISNNSFINTSFNGGAVYISNCNEISFYKSNFYNNQPVTTTGDCLGGAVHIEWSGFLDLDNDGTSISFDSCTFNNNTATSTGANAWGGTFYLFEVRNLEIKNSEFSDSNAEFGGAFYLIGVRNSEIKNSEFNHSNADEYGGAFYITFSDNLKLQQNSFSDNFANIDGGGIYITQCDYFENVLTIEECDFIDNAAQTGSGGAIRMHNVTIASISDSLFEQNWVDSNGGAIYLNNASTLTQDISIDNCLFFNNYSINGDGNVIYNQDYDTIQITNNSFIGNFKSSGAVNHDLTLNNPGTTLTIIHENFFTGAGTNNTAINELTNTVNHILTNNIFSAGTYTSIYENFGGPTISDINFNDLNIIANTDASAATDNDLQ
ncbi:MAG: hypothetical protein MJB14_17590 [Spirochaetes bacterium]|nr:hypothetical protein [Spirochaetota bacterium]